MVHPALAASRTTNDRSERHIRLRPRAEPNDYEGLIRAAREVADELLERYLGLPVEKAIDLHTRGRFDLAVDRLAAELRRETTTADGEALHIALRVLDVDWRRTSTQQRRELVARAMAQSSRATASVPRRIKVVFGRRANQIMAATRRDARLRQGLSISAEFNAIDQRIINQVVSSQALFVTGEYGRRQDDAGQRAQTIVARGLEQGLGRDEIAANLHRELSQILVGRGIAYWEVVASAFAATDRSHAQMSAYAEAGIERYRVSAVLDEATTVTCRFLDGKVLSVRAALDRFARVERLGEAEAIKSALPWVREGSDEGGRRRLFVTRGRDRQPIAQVERSGLGTRDDRGQHSRVLTVPQLDALGIGFPPYHSRCRTTTLPVIP